MKMHLLVSTGTEYFIWYFVELQLLIVALLLLRHFLFPIHQWEGTTTLIVSDEQWSWWSLSSDGQGRGLCGLCIVSDGVQLETVYNKKLYRVVGLADKIASGCSYKPVYCIHHQDMKVACLVRQQDLPDCYSL